MNLYQNHQSPCLIIPILFSFDHLIYRRIFSGFDLLFFLLFYFIFHFSDLDFHYLIKSQFLQAQFLFYHFAVKNLKIHQS